MIVAGVDEAGRGPLAGPVVAAAVILQTQIDGITDSKALSHAKREHLYQLIIDKALSFALGIVEAEEIDRINIHQATLLAMKRAIEGLSIQPTKLLIDGLYAPQTSIPSECIVKGDLKETLIGAASIIAKVERDRMMNNFDQQFPQYGFSNHKGYATKEHKLALMKHGPCPIHRYSFEPVIYAKEAL
ncbi:ribonuclease HII [Legionella sp. W05-934-2]|jgi:ribonuclease HII|uniref:ribonuclease HII n=1 Tax=Legionella sp. W05-934-2 TaxID=1198649 RepID=UPI0034618AA7